MSRNWKIAIGVTAVIVGFMLVLAMIGGGILLRTRSFPTMMDHPALTDSQEETVAPRDYGMSGHHDSFSHFSPRSRTPFGFIGGIFGGLFRLAALGVLGLLLFRIFSRRSQAGGNGAARVLSEDDDEGDSPTEPDELSVDDLLQAMKRLGIKKLEL